MVRLMAMEISKDNDIECLKKNHQKQIKEYKQSIKKNTNEIAKLKELENDMQSTNDFLTEQINKLINKLITEEKSWRVFFFNLLNIIN